MANKEEILQFSREIEKIVRDASMSYMDAIIFYCEKTGIEVEIASKLISPVLKSKIKTEAENLNFLPKSNSKLPV